MRSSISPANFRRLAGLFFVMLLSAMTFGCASTSTTIVDQEVVTNSKPMASYKSLVVRDFELKRELYTDSADTSQSTRDLLYDQYPSILAENIVRYVKARHTYQDVSRSGQVTATTLVLKGRFTRVGRFRVSIVGTLHDGVSDEEVALFSQTLWDVFDTTGNLSQLSSEIAGFIDRIQYK